tara:strand:+ start:1676 stop:2026 length:351 start_codon:yes stop_codon:yes gene_type:complete
MNDYIQPLLGGIVQTALIIVGAAVGWFYGGKATKKRELKSSDLDNEIKSADYYKGLLDDMSQRLENAIKELMQLEERVLQLMQTNRELVDTNNKLMESNKELLVDLQKFKQLNGKR